MIARKVVCRMTKREARAWPRPRARNWIWQAVGRGMAALFSLPQWRGAGAVLAFAAMPDEPDTAEILRRALADGNACLLPRVRSKTEMDWVEIPALRLLRPGAFGIQEPPADRPAADPAGYAHAGPCPLPGRQPRRVRLGRGGGYYDRFLAHYKGGRAAALPRGPAAGRAALRRLGRPLCAREYSDRERNFTMKKAAFCNSPADRPVPVCLRQPKDDSNDLANQPATRPEEGAELDPEFSVDDEDTGETAEPQPDAELSEMVDAIYDVQPVDLMGMETGGHRPDRRELVRLSGGLTADNVGKVDAAVVSEPDDRKPGVQPGAAAPQGQSRCPRDRRFDGGENISMRKWVCVEADKARVVSFDDKLLYVMADSELVDVDLLADAAAKAFDATFDVDDSLVNEDESELPRSCCPPRLWH